jgi:anti-sigma-K factor RskA
VKHCEQFREWIEAYALGALDAGERTTFEAHLASGCEDCEKEVAEARVVVSQLAYLAPSAEPSDILRGRLIETVGNEARAARTTGKMKSGAPVWLWAGVAALLLVSLYSAWDGRRLSNELRNVSGQAAAEIQQRLELERHIATLQREKTILTDPASVKIPLPPAQPHAAVLEATWHSKLGLVISGQKVAAPANGRVLQLWLIPKSPGGKPTPSLTVRPDADGKVFLLVANPPEAMENTKALAITEEPPGGSLQPTTTPQWVGGIS